MNKVVAVVVISFIGAFPLNAMHKKSSLYETEKKVKIFPFFIKDSFGIFAQRLQQYKERGFCGQGNLRQRVASITLLINDIIRADEHAQTLCPGYYDVLLIQARDIRRRDEESINFLAMKEKRVACCCAIKNRS